MAKKRSEFARNDMLRAALLGLALRTFSDDFLELLDGTAPSEQALDASLWTTSLDERRGVEEKLHNILADLETRLAEIGVRGMLIVASERYLLDEQRRIRERLYGPDETPKAAVFNLHPDKKE
jgi:hypothetical protein